MEKLKKQKYSLRAVYLICIKCKKVYRIKASHHLKSSYCSKPCMADDYKSRMSGGKNPNFKMKGYKICKTCGKTYHNYQKTSYCSTVCIPRDKPFNIESERNHLFKIKRLIKSLNRLLVTKRKECEVKKSKSCAACSAPIPKYKVFCSNNCRLSKMSGHTNPNYKGGRKPLKERIRAYTKPLSKEALKRDSYTCQKCGQVGGRLEADHIYPFSKIFHEFTKKNKGKSEEELFQLSLNHAPFHNITNLQTLCRQCNMKKFNRIPEQMILV